MRAPRSGRVAVLVLAPLLLSGCQLLFPYMYATGTPDFPVPSFGPEVSYTTGTASFDILQGTNRQHVVLDQLVDGAGAMDGMTSAAWRNADGWSMSLMDFAVPDMPADPGSILVTIQRVHDNQVWIADTFTGQCASSVSEASDTRLAGSTTCQHLQWEDGTAGSNGLGSPSYIAGQDPFSATITFEATP